MVGPLLSVALAFRVPFRNALEALVEYADVYACKAFNAALTLQKVLPMTELQKQDPHILQPLFLRGLGLRRRR